MSKETRTCILPGCNNTFRVFPNDKQKYCSKACGGVGRTKPKEPKKESTVNRNRAIGEEWIRVMKGARWIIRKTGKDTYKWVRRIDPLQEKPIKQRVQKPKPMAKKKASPRQAPKAIVKPEPAPMKVKDTSNMVYVKKDSRTWVLRPKVDD